MGNGLLAFAAGLGSGYLSAKENNLERERQSRLDAQNQQLFDMKMADATRANQDRAKLAEAGRTATVDNGAVLGLADGTQTAYSDPGVANSDFRQLRSADQATGNQTLAQTPLVVPPLPPGLAGGQIPQANNPSAYTAPDSTSSLADGVMPQAPQSSAVVNGKSYGSDFKGAQTAADTFNAGRTQRVIDAKYGIGDPSGALSMEANALRTKELGLSVDEKQAQAERTKFNDTLMNRARVIGVGQAIAELGTKTSVGGLDGSTVKYAVDEAKGVQTLAQIDGSGKVVGQKQYPVGPYGDAWMLHDASQTPLADQVKFNIEQQKYGDTRLDKAETVRHNKATEANAADKTAMGLEIATIRLQAAKDRLANGGAPSKEERLRYTNLFSDAGRRMAETQKTAATLTKSLNEQTTMNGKAPDTPEITATRQQLAGLQNDYNSYKEERATYQALLAGSQGTAKPGLGSGKEPTATATSLPRPANKAEYDKIPKGASYIYTDGTTRVKN